MFFVLSQILGFFVHPLVWILIVIALAVIVKDVLKRNRLIIAAFVMFLFFTNNFITDEVMRWWEYPNIKTSELDSCYDVGLLLGGGMVNLAKETDRLVFRNNPDRLFQTISLYKTKRIKKIFISSGAGNLIYRDMLEASLIKRYMLEIGIPDSVINVDSLSDNTRENALFTSKILAKQKEPMKILLITSATHMRRAAGCFKKVGIQFTPFAVDKYVGKRRYQLDYLLVPNVNCINKWDKLLHEWVGFLMYRMMGYV
jgi:uncharacterized SAM-binding protein YcdF (DUF218 family)